jgi:hypothetical protein
MESWEQLIRECCNLCARGSGLNPMLCLTCFDSSVFNVLSSTLLLFYKKYTSKFSNFYIHIYWSWVVFSKSEAEEKQLLYRLDSLVLKSPITVLRK